MENALFKLSIETLENVISFIDHPKDLLSLAQTTSRLCQIIIPNHLELRHIRCDPRREDLWKKLVEKPVLAANIRKLELDRYLRTYWLRTRIRSRSTNLVPRFFAIGEAPSVDEYNLDFLVKAIQLMTSLTSFSWVGPTPRDVDRVFRALDSSSAVLQELQIFHIHLPTAYSPDLKPFSMLVKHLTTLNTLSIRGTAFCVDCYSSFYDALITQGLALRDIYICFPSLGSSLNSQFQTLFRLAHWPELRRFTIQGDFTGELASAWLNEADGFIDRHVKLEALSLDKLGPPMLKPNQLPSLHSLDFSWSSGVNSMDGKSFSVPIDIARNLRHLGTHVSDTQGIQVYKHMSSLQTACLDSVPSLIKFVKFVPNLERLYYKQHITKNFRKQMDIRMKHLSSLRKLTHLSEFFVTPEISILSPKNEERLKTLANSLPSLMYVEVMFQQRGWVVIERDKEEHYTGYRDATPAEEKRLDPSRWGTYFTGSSYY